MAGGNTISGNGSTQLIYTIFDTTTPVNPTLTAILNSAQVNITQIYLPFTVATNPVSVSDAGSIAYTLYVNGAPQTTVGTLLLPPYKSYAVNSGENIESVYLVFNLVAGINYTPGAVTNVSLYGVGKYEYNYYFNYNPIHAGDPTITSSGSVMGLI
jgi:hypothetical protein